MLDYREYLDKTYGCWLGKCVVGTIGAPYEGMKQLLHLSFDEKMIQTMLPNDDLDLQVLWLSVLEQKGVYTTGEDLAEAFSEKNIYWPGEYAWFKRNYDRGIRPPYSAKYENDFYMEGMGCPIRAEIWGLILPGNPALAARLCTMDGTLDHEGNSVYFEQFWAAMVSAAFFESDLKKLIGIGLSYIPEDSRAAALIRDVTAWCEQTDNWLYIRSRLIAEYGHCDCTNSFQNIGLTLMILLLCGDDLKRAGIMACNCGFDTDCTAGNAGALMGLLLGGKALEERFGFRDSGYVLTLRYSRPTDKIIDLARDTCAVGLHFLRNLDGAENPLAGVPDGAEREISYRPAPVRLENFYDVPPYIGPGESIDVRFELRAEGEARNFDLYAASPRGFETEISERSVTAGGGNTASFTVRVRMDGDVRTVNETNLFTLTATDGSARAERKFGVVGKTVYTMFGPFWENNIEIDLGDNSRHYNSFFEYGSEQDFADALRFYHLNMRTDPDKEYMTLGEIGENAPDRERYERNGREVGVCGDIVRLSDITSFYGPCTVYLKRTVVLEKRTEFRVHIGYSDAYRMYLNGKLVSERKDEQNWTPENVHLIPVALEAGENTIVLRLCRRGGGDKFSLTFLEFRDCPPHVAALNSQRERR